MTSFLFSYWDILISVVFVIESLDNKIVKYLCKLNMPKYRRMEKKFIVEGKHLVDEAKKYGILEEAFSVDEMDGYT